MKKISNKTNGLLNFMDLRYGRYKLIYGIMAGLLILLSLVCVLPIIWVAVSGFKTQAEFYSVPPTLLPAEFDFKKIANIWSKLNFFRYFKSTVFLILGGLVFDIVINGLCGYVLSRVKPLGSKLLETLIFGTMLLPGISMVPLYMTFVDMPLIHVNLTGSYLPLWMLVGCKAFTVMLFRNFFNGIPMDYIESARMDGCSTLGIFFKIILPLSKPIIVVEAIFCVMGMWKDFMWPYLILGSTEKETISILLYHISSGSLPLTELDAMLVIMLTVIPPGLFYCIFSRQIMGGVSMSGIKG